jgi:hypothetical protein
VPTRELSGEFVRRFYALIPRSGLSRAQRALAHTMVDAMRE